MKAYVRMEKNISMTSLFKKLKNAAHFHQCINRDCRKVRDCNCGEPEKNKICHLCAGLRCPLWCSQRDPHECCRDNCKQITNRDELQRYRLAGPSPWYQCQSCARAHGWPLGYNPNLAQPQPIDGEGNA